MSTGMSQHGQMSPRDYSSTSSAPAPHIKLEQAASNLPQYQSNSSVPNVLQPAGGMGSRPPAISSNTAPALPTMQQQQHQQQQQQEYQTPSKPPPTLTLSHTYSRSSPAAPYDGAGSYLPYTPTTPGGSSSQYMSPSDTSKYGAPGSQRNISNTPLGLADIRPRADSSLSDGMPGSLAYELANTQPGPSNYLAPWALYAFDWCKWPAQGSGAGKLALGSYLEDGHNFVSGTRKSFVSDSGPLGILPRAQISTNPSIASRYKFSRHKSFRRHPTSFCQEAQRTAWSSPRLLRPHIRTPSPVSSGSHRPRRSSPPISSQLPATT